jgi:hypothetical protein
VLVNVVRHTGLSLLGSLLMCCGVAGAEDPKMPAILPAPAEVDKSYVNDHLHESLGNRRWVFPGANGEIVFAPRDATFRPPALALLRLEERLVAVDVYGTLGGGEGSCIFSVGPDRRIKFHAKMPYSRPSIIPQTWPAVESKDRTATLPAGMIVERMGRGRGADRPAPPEALGWAVLLLEDCVFVPSDQANRPENVLWMIPDGGGLKLVHSGPVRKGTYATIDANRKVVIHDSTSVSQSQIDEHYWWIYVTESASKVSPPPYDQVYSLHNRTHCQYIMVRDGEMWGANLGYDCE